MWKFILQYSLNSFNNVILGEPLGASEDAMQKDFKPKLLTGEIEAARAGNVGLYIAQKIKIKVPKSAKSKKSETSNNKIGLLIITNFRLSFVSFDDNDENSDTAAYQENAFLGKFDITLSNIDEIYQISGRKKNLVTPQNKNSNKIDAIRIICKNFRVLTFDFKTSDVGKGKYIADALVKFAFPTRHNLLFLYNYREKYYNSSRSIRMYNQKTDWTQELERCGISQTEGGWRVLSLDKPDNNSLPMHCVIPKHMSDFDFFKISAHFRCTRSAIWVWSLNNASLIRMADLLPDLTTNTHENTMLEHVRRCDPGKKQPVLMELGKLLPSIQDVFISYTKLRELCAPESDRQFMVQDEKFNTLLDKSCWILYVSLCLKFTNDAADKLKNGETVVLQENDGRDLSCLLSSLVQIVLDPYFRTIPGLQTLIQKEWVTLGHPFSDRFGHVVTQTSEKSPLFLLFLDCVWQLLQQFPEAFEYSETFLTTIWDSVFLPVFDTFQFNCEYDRQVAINSDKLIQRPVWDWGEQFQDKDIALFSNPLYRKPQLNEQDIEQYRKSKLPPSAFRLPALDEIKALHNHQNVRQSFDIGKLMKSVNIEPAVQTNPDKFLMPKYDIIDLEIWTQCYYRWMPVLEIKGGGFAQVDLHNRILVNNIHKLQKAIETGNLDELPPELQRNGKTELPKPLNPSDDDDDVLREDVMDAGPSNRLPMINSFFPFSSNIGSSDELADMLILNGELLTEGSIFDATSIAYQFND